VLKVRTSSTFDMRRRVDADVFCADFVKGASRFRPRDDPLLTKELLDSLLKVSVAQVSA
jgi:hypothetical protein